MNKWKVPQKYFYVSKMFGMPLSYFYETCDAMRMTQIFTYIILVKISKPIAKRGL